MSAPKPLRADAQRNRDRLVEAAVQAFSHGDAEVTLESIAKDAGVGIGTLYRHFPTREALVEAAYRNELAKLCDAVPELLRTKPADEALRTWLAAFVDYVTTKKGMGDALKAVIASGGNPFEHSRARLSEAITALVAAGVQAGTVRSDIDVWDILAHVGGVAMVAGQTGQDDMAGRMLDLLMDGLRYRAGN